MLLLWSRRFAFTEPQNRRDMQTGESVCVCVWAIRNKRQSCNDKATIIYVVSHGAKLFITIVSWCTRHSSECWMSAAQNTDTEPGEVRANHFSFYYVSVAGPWRECAHPKSNCARNFDEFCVFFSFSGDFAKSMNLIGTRMGHHHHHHSPVGCAWRAWNRWLFKWTIGIRAEDGTQNEKNWVVNVAVHSHSTSSLIRISNVKVGIAGRRECVSACAWAWAVKSKWCDKSQRNY